MNTKHDIIKKTYFFLFVFLTCLVVSPAFARAETTSRITVEFENQPLFSKTNFAPGESETRFIRVANNTDAEKEVVITATNFSACSILPWSACLAKKLETKIFSGDAVYFGGEIKTLSDFFNTGEISLGKLSSGTTKKYEMSVFFSPGPDDNSYQAKSSGFDLSVGFRNGNTSGGGNGNGGNGGGNGVGSGVSSGAVFFQTLQINNIRDTIVIDSEGSVFISWNTNIDSYGHVIYGKSPAGIYALNLSKTNFGYPASNPSDPYQVGHIDGIKGTAHSVMLSNLIPGEYSYRIVAHASPPTVSYERSFVIPKPAVKNTDEEINQNENTVTKEINQAENVFPATPKPKLIVISNENPFAKASSSQNTIQSSSKIQGAGNIFNLAAVGFFANILNFWWVLIIAIGGAIWWWWFIWKRCKEKEKENK